jgi:hypothetical protein
MHPGSYWCSEQRKGEDSDLLSVLDSWLTELEAKIHSWKNSTGQAARSSFPSVGSRVKDPVETLLIRSC